MRGLAAPVLPPTTWPSARGHVSLFNHASLFAWPCSLAPLPGRAPAGPCAPDLQGFTAPARRHLGCALGADVAAARRATIAGRAVPQWHLGPRPGASRRVRTPSTMRVGAPRDVRRTCTAATVRPCSSAPQRDRAPRNRRAHPTWRRGEHGRGVLLTAASSSGARGLARHLFLFVDPTVRAPRRKANNYFGSVLKHSQK